MNSSIRVRARVSFRGETHDCSKQLDLDPIMERDGGLPDFHRLLAAACDIDTYSYLYEVLEATELEFDQATGLAAECMADGRFDTGAFAERWHAQRETRLLDAIARSHLGRGVDDLPGLNDALREAYAAGRAAGGA